MFEKYTTSKTAAQVIAARKRIDQESMADIPMQVAADVDACTQALYQRFMLADLSSRLDYHLWLGKKGSKLLRELRLFVDYCERQEDACLDIIAEPPSDFERAVNVGRAFAYAHAKRYIRQAVPALVSK